MTRVTQQDFQRLLEFRVALREFQRWSEDQAEAAGLTHVQHQLLVAIKGHQGNRPPAVGDLAGYLLLRPHSTVELIDRTRRQARHTGSRHRIGLASRDKAKVSRVRPGCLRIVPVAGRYGRAQPESPERRDTR